MFIPFKKVKKENFKEIEDEKIVKFLEGENILPVSYTDGKALFVDCKDLQKALNKYKSEGLAV